MCLLKFEKKKKSKIVVPWMLIWDQMSVIGDLAHLDIKTSFKLWFDRHHIAQKTQSCLKKKLSDVCQI